MLRDSCAEKRQAAAEWLVRVGPASVPAVLRTLRSRNADARLSAAWILGQLGSHEAVMPLVKALQDKDPDVRLSAAGALGELRSPGAIDALSGLVEGSAEEPVRWRAN